MKTEQLHNQANRVSRVDSTSLALRGLPWGTEIHTRHHANHANHALSRTQLYPCIKQRRVCLWTSATVFQQLTAIKIDMDSSLSDQIVKKGVSVRRLCVDNFLLPLTARLRSWGLLLPASIDICMLYISVHWHHGSSSVLIFNTRKTLFAMFPTPPCFSGP